jgi:hypothetical protein
LLAGGLQIGLAEHVDGHRAAGDGAPVARVPVTMIVSPSLAGFSARQPVRGR